MRVLPKTRLLLAALAAASMVLTSCNGFDTMVYRAKLDGAEHAVIELDPAAGQDLSIGPVADPALLFEAEADHVHDMDFKVSGDMPRVVRLAEAQGSLALNLFDDTNMRWRVGLNPAVALDLEIDAPTGHLDADLRALRLDELEIEFNSGDAEVRLPASPTPIAIRGMDFDSGAVTLDVPDGVTLDFQDRLRLKSGAVLMHLGAGVVFDATVVMGSGSLTLDVAEDAAVRIDVQDAGSGELALPSDYVKVQGRVGETTGVWESPAAARSSNLLVLNVTMGSGQLSVQ